MAFLDAGKLELPEMRLMRRRFEVPEAIDALSGVQGEWDRIRHRIDLPRGGRVAVCVGSRGIANLAPVVKAVVDLLKSAGCAPFVTPAMGSHGGATAEGQIEVLKLRGITEETVGAPVLSAMEVVPMGQVKGIPLFIDRLAREADGIVLINRVKPHTNFIGATESGLIKMIAIGLGNQKGAEHYHRLSVIRDQYEIIGTAGKALLERCNVLFGVGLVENQEHQTCILLGQTVNVRHRHSGIRSMIAQDLGKFHNRLHLSRTSRKPSTISDMGIPIFISSNIERWILFGHGLCGQL